MKNYNNKINKIFGLINELSQDKAFQERLKEIAAKDTLSYDEMRIYGFAENLIDAAKNGFNYYKRGR